MAYKDLASYLEAQINGSVTANSDATFNGNSVDTAHYENGLMFTGRATSYTDGDHAMGAEESDDEVTWTTVPAEKIIGSATISAAYTDETALPKIGIFANKRYVRPTVVSTSVTTGATIEFGVIQGAELVPTP